MLPEQKAELIQLKSQLVAGMEDYRNAIGAECDYSEQDIVACADIIDAYLTAVDQYTGATSSDRIMGEVKRVVLNLNNLNEHCNETLIETDQREQICEIIIKAAGYAGLKSNADDVTEKWRDW